MSNVINIEPVRYAQEELKTSALGLILSREDNYLDMTNAVSVTAGVSNCSLPVGTDARFIFCVYDDGSWGDWQKLDNAGALEDLNFTVDNNAETAELILEYGNTVSELSELADIPAFVGYKVRVGIALIALDPDNAVPQVKFALNGVSNTQLLSKTIESPIQELGELSTITAMNSVITTENGGTCTLTGKYWGETGSESEYMDLQELIGQQASKMQYKAVLRVPDLISDSSVELSKITASYVNGSNVLNGDTTSEIITVSRDWREDLRHVRLWAKHTKLKDSVLRSYVSLRSKPVKITGEQLGTGTGAREVYELAHKSGVRLSSVRLYYNGLEDYGTVDINCEVGRVTCIAPLNSVVTCDYEYNWGLEEWRELTLRSREDYETYTKSEWDLMLAPGEYEGLTVAALKIDICRTTGNVTGEVLGYGTGTQKVYKISHIVNNGVIRVYSGGNILNESSYMMKDDPEYIEVVSSAGQELTCDYDWVSERCKVYEIGGSFSG